MAADLARIGAGAELAHGADAVEVEQEFPHAPRSMEGQPILRFHSACRYYASAHLLVELKTAAIARIQRG